MLPRHLVAFLVCVFAIALAAGACTNRAGGGAPDPLRGDKYFKAKCNACHPGGGQGAGPTLIGKPLPGPLKKSSSGGRHNVPAAEWDSLLLYLTPIVNPQAAVPSAPAAMPMPVAPAPMNPVSPVNPMTSPAAAPTVSPPTAAIPVAPAAPAMKPCNCNCNCPVGNVPGDMQNCVCACACAPS